MEENKQHIPEGWRKSNLSSVCKIRKGEQLNKIELSATGLYPCINGGIEPSGYSDRWNTEGETITISEGGNSCGFVNFLFTKFWSGGHCYSLLDLDKSTNKRFLYQSLKVRQRLIMDLRVGSGLPNIQQNAIKELEICFPQSKAEQTQIASILSTVDKAITQTEQLIAKYERIKTGLMQDLLTKGIDKNGNIRSEATHEFKDSPLGRIPVEWEVGKLGDFCISKHKGSIQTGPFGSQLHSKDYKEEGTPIITVEHLKEEEIVHNNLPLVGDKDYKRLKKYKLINGDLVFSRVGAIDRCSIVADKENNWLFSGRCLRLRPGKLFIARFLLYQMNFDSISSQIKNDAVGSTMKCLNTKILSNIIVVKPKIGEQDKITQSFKKLKKMKIKYKKEQSKLKFLKTGLMQDLLSGKVRVNG